MQPQATMQGLPLNRAERRQLARQQRARPGRRQMVTPRDPIGMVQGRISPLRPDEIAYILQPARTAFAAMRQAVATEDDWRNLMALVYFAQAVETGGVVTGLREHFAAAEAALEALCKRVQAGAHGAAWGRSTALYFDEITALGEAIDLAKFQLEQLSAAEVNQAQHRALSDPRSRRLQPRPAAQAHAPEPVQEKLV